MERFGLRSNLGLGCAAQAVCVALKWGGVALCASHRAAYALLLVGQLVGGLGQPLLLNVVSRLTADWFPVNEVDLATVVGFQASNFGALLFNALPAWLVHTPDDLAGLFLAQLLPWLLLLALFPRCVAADAPPKPPSEAAALQRRLRAAASAAAAAAAADGGGSPGGAAVRGLVRDLGALGGDPNFRCLAAAFSCSAGMSWALPSVEGVLLLPCGYGPKASGAAGACLTGAGVLACLAFGPLLRRWHGSGSYASLQARLAGLTVAGGAALAAARRPGNLPLLLSCWALFGAAVGPIGPVTLQHAAALSFPMPADSSAAALFFVSNLASFAQVSVLSAILAASRRAARLVEVRGGQNGRGSAPGVPRVFSQCGPGTDPSGVFVVVCLMLGWAAASCVQPDSHSASRLARFAIRHAHSDVPSLAVATVEAEAAAAAAAATAVADGEEGAAREREVERERGRLAAAGSVCTTAGGGNPSISSRSLSGGGLART